MGTRSGIWASILLGVLIFIVSLPGYARNPHMNIYMVMGSLIFGCVLIYVLHSIILHFYANSEYWGTIKWFCILFFAVLVISVIICALVSGIFANGGNSSATYEKTPNLTGKLETFNKYGFSFQYPPGVIIEEPQIKTDQNSFDQGEIQFNLHNEYGYIYWKKEPTPPTDPPQFTKERLSLMSQICAEEGVGKTTFSDPVILQGRDHKYAYYPVRIYEVVEYHGGLIDWYCPQSGRVFIFILSTDENSDFVKKRILQYVSRMKCHA